MSFPWAVSYRDAAPDPFWGEPTSAVNFCEEDYIITKYIGEFFNTLTSLLYIAYGIHGIRRFRRQGAGSFENTSLSYWALIGVGIFSGLYHTTLKYHTQMSDELSMHLAIGTVLQQTWCFQEPPKIQRRNTAIILGILVPFVIYHCVTDEFVLHVLLFFCMCWIVAYRVRYIIHIRIKEREHRQRLRSLLTFASMTALTSYGIWNIDVNFCSTLTTWKRQLGMPLGILLELHGWWHIGTAVAAYTFMSIIEFLVSPEDLESHGVGFAWPAKAILQDLAPKAVMNGNANGHTKGE
ncbi:hypothetical protein M409DRAFT_23787 [Zasmidium cellare ATCC 36951]|uniref:Alkaline phytoceramidase n=1 Tax=Zasmidium cellare ATCC 36951 TaxID=1080233 RepID=A0A6A6CK20_ZASCE|nr:uncharacterized protein M409DRAFT_23787 [Zasmidium cellare ATCC 36951]KAF2166059.1 hypothetical protein M409DRAFT_23787 [Zasmidium cellare ATCC 36951]